MRQYTANIVLPTAFASHTPLLWPHDAATPIVQQLSISLARQQ